MNLITPEIRNAIRGSEVISFSRGNYISISASAVVRYEFTLGSYLHFVTEKNSLYIYENSNKDTGFYLGSDGHVNEKNRNRRLRVCCTELMRELVRKYNVPPYSSFYLQDSEKKFNGHKLIEVLIKRPLK